MKRIKLVFALALLVALLTGCNQEAAAPTEPPLPQSYQLALTPEQAEQFESGRFYLMRQFGRDRFLPFYTSESVRLEGDQLIADFNSKVLYFVNDAGTYALIETQEMQTVEGVTHYVASLVLDEFRSETEDLITYPTTFELHVAYDRESEALVNAQVADPYAFTQVDLFGSESAPLVLPDARYCTYRTGEYRYIVRDKNGTPLPLSQWEYTGNIWAEIDSGKGATLRYADLTTAITPFPMNQGDVVLVFEVTNKDSSGWCSEPIPVSLRNQKPVAPQSTPEQLLQVNWTEGNSIRLLEKDGITVILRKDTSPSTSGISYALELKNDTEDTLNLYAEDIVFNDSVLCSSRATIYSSAGTWKSVDFPFGIEAGEALQAPLQKLSFRLVLGDASGFFTDWEMPVEVTLSEETAITPYWAEPTVMKGPCLEFMAQEDQVLLEQDGVRFTLLCMGDADDSGRLTLLLQTENTAQEPRRALFSGILLNGAFRSLEQTKTLQPGQIYYYRTTVPAEDLEANRLESIHQADLLLSAGSGDTDQLLANAQRCPVAATAAGTAPSQQPMELPVLWEAEGLRIYVESIGQEYGQTVWQLILENTSQENIRLAIPESYLANQDGTPVESAYVTLDDKLIPANSRVYTELSASVSGQDLYLRFRLLTADQGTILHTQEDAILLPTP